MKYYDARIIQGCCVFSYEVKTPDSSSKKGRKKKNVERTAFSLKKFFLRLFFLFLLPIISYGKYNRHRFSALPRRARNEFEKFFRCRELTACILSAISATALIPLALLLL